MERGKMNKATANYNMTFNNGTFKKDKDYDYEYKNKNVYVTTEEGKKQELLETEFNILFTFLKN